MNRLPQLYRLGSLLTVCLLALGSAACGGGGGGSPPIMPGPLTATFTPANANPGANTLNMTATTSAANFSIQVNVTDITDFFGAAYTISFNPATAQYVGFTSTGSVLEGQGTTDFRAQAGAAGEVLVNASLQGQVQGVAVNGTQLLLTLNFRATAATANNPFGFDVAATRELTTCPAPPAACTILADGNLTWSGGTMQATN